MGERGGGEGGEGRGVMGEGREGEGGGGRGREGEGREWERGGGRGRGGTEGREGMSQDTNGCGHR